ncbi:MBL fold metallo-hydrolase RNA specificity domain-containing protein [Embleya sp. NPDC059259]
MEGARTLKMFGTYVPVSAEVVNIPGLSAHADADEMPA